MNIGILGIGKLGLCFGLNLENKGFTVVGVDVHEGYVNSINSKTLFSFEPQVNELLKASLNFSATTAITEVLADDFMLLFIMVATPSLPDGSYDHTQIEHVAEQLIAFGKREKQVHLVIGCTTMPGYCDDLAKRLEHFNYTVSYNPEFIAQGDIIRNQLYPDQVLIGEANETTGDLIEEVFTQLCENKPVYCRMSRSESVV